MFLVLEGRRGLVGLFVMYKSHGAKGRRNESRSFSSYFVFIVRKSSKSTKESRKEETRYKGQERRTEVERPAGVSGLDVQRDEKNEGSLRRRLNS